MMRKLSDAAKAKCEAFAQMCQGRRMSALINAAIWSAFSFSSH
jgi:hypothetical protein